MNRLTARLVTTVCCTALPFAAVADGVSESAHGEFPEEARALVKATSAYFDAVEAEGKAQNRRPVIGVPLAITRSRADTVTDETAFLTRMGPVDHLTGYRITWYPMEKLHGTVDFMGTWDGNRNLVCGYLSWDMSDPEAPELTTVTASFVDIRTILRGSATDNHRTLLEANCAYGSIEANYRVFDVSG